MPEETENKVETFFKTFSGKDSIDKDLEDFGKRVSSYIAGQKWVRRPLALSPAVCSQYGWTCINSNLLQCACTAKLVVPDPKIEIYNAYTACIEKVLNDLKASHKAHCPWPLTPSPDSFVKMTAMPKEESLKFFLKRLKSSLEFESSFPQIEESIPELLELDEKIISSLCKLGNTFNGSATFATSAVCLAATGWTIKSEGESKTTFLTCESCQRSMWSGSFYLIDILDCSAEKKEDNGVAQNEVKKEDLGESSPPKKKRIKKEKFHPLKEHRPWCLWITPGIQSDEVPIKTDSPQASTAGSPGWKIYIKSLLRNIAPQHTVPETTPSKEKIRSVRSLLDSWTDSVE